jgi:hypothetical protein
MSETRTRKPPPEVDFDYTTKASRSEAWPTMNAEQRAAMVETLRLQGEGKRWICNMFQFWTACGPACRRARGCVGDAQECCERFWPHLPEPMKVWVRVAIKALGQGATPLEACDKANQAAHFQELVEAGEGGATALPAGE